jgi:hypothetical protein
VPWRGKALFLSSSMQTASKKNRKIISSWMAGLSASNPPPPLQRDAPPWHGLFPPSTWQPDALVSEQIDLWLPYETPPGTYHLVMGLYNSETMARYPAFAGTTHLTHDEVDLGRVTVVQ